MNKMHKNAEETVINNPEKYGAKAKESNKVKVDLVENTVTVEAPKKQKKGQLDPQQVAEVQKLVMKRFKTVRKDIIMEDDFETFNYLSKMLSQARDEENEQGKKLNFNVIRNPSQGRKQSPGILNIRNRRESPVMGTANNIKVLNQNQTSCDFASQSGVKVLTNLNQIATKKIIIKKGGSGV